MARYRNRVGAGAAVERGWGPCRRALLGIAVRLVKKLLVPTHKHPYEISAFAPQSRTP